MARPTFEACESLVIAMGDAAAVSLGTVDMRVAPFVELAHLERRSDGRPVRYRVSLLSTPQPFGGMRLWFLCPVTGRRATKLVLPRGGCRFASRGAWGLGYTT